MLERPVLVLNRNWQPVNVATVARALVLLCQRSARVVDLSDCQTYTWEDWSKLRPGGDERYIQTVRFRLRVPDVITPAYNLETPSRMTRAAKWKNAEFPKVIKPSIANHW